MPTIIYQRTINKTGNGVPTIPPSASHDLGDWIATDIYEGEFYTDLDTRKVYTRVGNSIVLVGTALPASAIAFAGCVGDNPPTEVDGDVYVLIKEVTSPIMDVDTIAFQVGTTHGVRYTFNEFSMMTDGAVAVGDYFHVSGAANPVHDGTFQITAFDDIAGWIQVNNPLVSSAADDEASDSTAIAHFTKEAWDGAKINDIAVFEASTGLWHHITPSTGNSILILDDNTEYVFDGTSWINSGYWTQDVTNLSTTAQRHVLPLNSNTQNLGSATKRWMDAHIEGSILSNASFRLSTARSIPTPDVNSNWSNLGDPYLGDWNIGLTPNFGEYVTEGADIYQNISGANSAVLPSLDGGSNWNFYDTNYAGPWSSGASFALGKYVDYSGFLYFHLTALQEVFKEMYFDGTTFFFRTNSSTWLTLDATKLTVGRIEGASGQLVLAPSSNLIGSTGTIQMTASGNHTLSAGNFFSIGIDSNDEIWMQDNGASDITSGSADKKAIVIATKQATVKQSVENALAITGEYPQVEHRGELVYGNYANAQSGKIAYYEHTDDATPTEITLNGSGSEYFTIPVNCVYHVTVKGLAVNQVTGDCAVFVGEGVVRNIAGTTSDSTIVITQTFADAGMLTTVLAVAADDTNDRLAVTVTGNGGTDIQWNVVIDYEKIKFA